ncbi:hypothetical protein Pyn_00893 [Prunus yedoensis var. nudiflora]|uniref:Uncharacterized protein n=1 Tax=Prunus yedoensis var. nudiflora TaxID=2094558 RepID=A0A314Z2Y9_PRUYE|nr:hypothetical protein Pyn_00893 [Prunus yedoensis var. nudiflora]
MLFYLLIYLLLSSQEVHTRFAPTEINEPGVSMFSIAAFCPFHISGIVVASDGTMLIFDKGILISQLIHQRGSLSNLDADKFSTPSIYLSDH